MKIKQILRIPKYLFIFNNSAGTELCTSVTLFSKKNQKQNIIKIILNQGCPKSSL